MGDVSAKKFGKVKLGDISVNRLGLGTNRIADNDSSRAILKKAVELGVNFIDTAKRYGQSQMVIGETLAPYDNGVVVATKGGWSDDNGPLSLEFQIDESLKLLKLKQIPLWHLHRVDPEVPLEQTMKFLKTQVDAGKIRHIGLSEVSIEQIEKAREILPIASVQNLYNLVDREHEEVIDYCTKNKIVFIPFYPLNSGSLVLNKRLQLVADKYGATSIQIAIAWLLKRSPMMLPIPGTLSPEHLESNIAAANINLAPEYYQYIING